MTLKVYHNPKSKTSRDVLKAIKEKGHNPIVVDCLRDPPGKSDLVDLINLMRVNVWDLVGDAAAKEHGIERNSRNLTTLIATLARNPQLLKYPIVATNTRAAVCQEAGKLDDIVKGY